MIYLDHNSTSPYSPSVKEYIKNNMLEDWENPSSSHPKSQTLHKKIRESRQFIADRLHCSSKHLFFTGSGTESINTILSLETLKLNQLSSIITSPLEHHATIKKTEHLTKTKNITWIATNEQGELDLKHLQFLCEKHPQSLISILSANNETGVITDVKRIASIAKKYGCLVHVDAVQSLGKMPISLEDWGVDFASFSGHKIGAMKGVGLLYAKKPFSPLMYGGGQERTLRPSTYNYPAIHSFKLAVQDIDLNTQNSVRKLRDYFEKALIAETRFEKVKNPQNQEITNYEQKTSLIKINCQKANRLPNTSNIYCGGVSNQALLLRLAQKGICVSAGSACNSGSPEPSLALKTLAQRMNEPSPKDYANSCIRVSLSQSNTKQEIDFFISALKQFLKKQAQEQNLSTDLPL